MSKPVGFTPGPWAYVASNENHGPYVTNEWGAGDICDCYTMSKPSELAVCNGGTSVPIHFQHDEADANARLIAAAPDMFEALKLLNKWFEITGSSVKHRWERIPAEDRAAIVAATKAAIAKAEGRS